MTHNDFSPGASNAVPLPFVTRHLAPIPGQLRVSPEDFQVEEIPAYEPSGQGPHLFVRFRKRGRTTPDAVKAIAQALEVNPRECGYAGLKDRHAVTIQWASFAGSSIEGALALDLPGIEVLSAVPHQNKLRTGHLRGNRFQLLVRDVPKRRICDAQAVLAHLNEHGVPNYFGEQRFGRGGQNRGLARAWLVDGGRAPRDRFKRKLFVSVLQSELFNSVLARRIEDGLFSEAVAGDLMRKEDSGGLFVTDDLEDAQARTAAFAISPTGPMFGPKMRWPEQDALLREEAALEAGGVTREHVDRLGRLGPGSRRVLRYRPAAAAEEVEGGMTVTMELPKGAYATVVMREILKQDAAEAGVR